MKYWNKNPSLRESWAVVKTRGDVPSMTELKRWCQQQPGGRFYCKDLSYNVFYYSGQVEMNFYFEKPEDASFFALKWS